jgi:hypothetical protein
MGTEEICPPCAQRRPLFAHNRAETPPDPVTRDRVANGFSDGKRDAWRTRGRAEIERAALDRTRAAAARSGQSPKRCRITDAPDQAERFARPLRRRRAITARPPRLRIRIRKPCFFERFRLFG